MGQRPQQVFLVPLLIGTDGTQKMSKSLNNYIGVTTPTEEMYGKVMSIPDHLIMPYFELITDVLQEELKEFSQQLNTQSVNPMLLKKRLAREIVTQFHSNAAAQDAEEHFARVIQKGEVPQEIQEYPISFADLTPDQMSDTPVDISKLLAVIGLVKSRSEANRLITQGAVEVDGERLTKDRIAIKLHPGSIIKVGKRRFVKLVKADR